MCVCVCVCVRVCVWWGGGGEGGRGGSGYVDETSRVTSTQKAKKKTRFNRTTQSMRTLVVGEVGGGGGVES